MLDPRNLQSMETAWDTYKVCQAVNVTGHVHFFFKDLFGPTDNPDDDEDMKERKEVLRAMLKKEWANDCATTQTKVQSLEDLPDFWASRCAPHTVN